MIAKRPQDRSGPLKRETEFAMPESAVMPSACHAQPFSIIPCFHRCPVASTSS